MSWFALTVKSQHEKAVADRLCERALEGYSPLYKARRRWSDRVRTVELPLFPSYVFCRFDFEERIKVLSTPGVYGVVGFGGQPCAIEDGEIEAVKTMAGSGLPVMPWPFLHVGNRVLIRQGPLAGLEGILLREKNDCRVVVNLTLLNRAVSVEIDRHLVSAVGASV